MLWLSPWSMGRYQSTCVQEFTQLKDSDRLQQITQPELWVCSVCHCCWLNNTYTNMMIITRQINKQSEERLLNTRGDSGAVSWEERRRRSTWCVFTPESISSSGASVQCLDWTCICSENWSADNWSAGQLTTARCVIEFWDILNNISTNIRDWMCHWLPGA